MADDTGEYRRKGSWFTERITADGSSRWPVEPGRYRLVAARACPWANRSLIVRRLLGLEGALPAAMAGPEHDERSWRFHLDPGDRDPVLGIEYLGTPCSPGWTHCRNGCAAAATWSGTRSLRRTCGCG